MTTLPNLAQVLESLDACAGPGESIEWATPFGSDWERAWATCERSDWMLWLAEKVGVEHKTLVAIACDCAEVAVARYWTNTADTRPADALKVTRAWLAGDATSQQVSAAAAAYAAYAAYATSQQVSAYAAAAAAAAADADADAAKKEQADFIRARISFVEMQRLLRAKIPQ